MPTALELTRQEWQRYIKAAQRRPAPPDLTPAEQQERERLLACARQAAAALKARFGAKRVILFGSLAHGAWFHASSDVDLAVERMDKDAYWDAWLLAEEMITGRPVNLIELETARESLLKAIRRHGVEL